MKKLLVICGPTATGKTSLALHLAKLLASGPEVSGQAGELISADSRQVYKWMNIGTGKDLPVNSKLKTQNSKLPGYYEVDGVKIWGYDLVGPTEEFSVSKYVQIVEKVIKDIWVRDKLPILVGGTGLYIKGVVNGISTAEIPKSLSLRQLYKGKTVDELQEILGSIDPFKLASMNVSDRKNLRRLVRAIEVASAKVKSEKLKVKSLVFDLSFIGLTAPKKYLDKNIDERVDMRVSQGIEKEIENLFKKGVTWSNQSMQALGYKQWEGFFENLKSLYDVVLSWKRAEMQYAKRQMTWFKPDKRINWFDISKDGWEKEVEKLVGKWYNEE
jgi:tRNA dimethylallyltransferase